MDSFPTYRLKNEIIIHYDHYELDVYTDPMYMLTVALKGILYIFATSHRFERSLLCNVMTPVISIKDQ